MQERMPSLILTLTPAVHRYCKPRHAFYDLAADVIAENPQYVTKHLNTDMQDFLQATIMQQVRACVCVCVCVCGQLHFC